MAVAATAFLAEDDQPVFPLSPDMPAVRQPTESSRASPEIVSPSATVLVVDDDGPLRETLADILELAGYDVLQAADGEEALRVLDRQPVHVLVLDMAMPRFDGLWVLEALGPPPPKVVVLSAFAYYSPEDIEGSDLGRKVTRTLRKPCPPVELLAAVSGALEELRNEG